MHKLRRAVRQAVSRLGGDTSGVTAIEYALVTAGVALGIIVLVWSVGDEVETTYTEVQTNLENRPN